MQRDYLSLLNLTQINYCVILQIDGPMLATEWKKPGMLRHFTVIRKLDGGIFPMGFAKESTDRNSKAGSNVLICEGKWVTY